MRQQSAVLQGEVRYDVPARIHEAEGIGGLGRIYALDLAEVIARGVHDGSEPEVRAVLPVSPEDGKGMAGKALSDEVLKVGVHAEAHQAGLSHIDIVKAVESLFHVCRAERSVVVNVWVYLPRHVVEVPGQAQCHAHVHVADDVEVGAVILSEIYPVGDRAGKGEPALELAVHLQVGAQVRDGDAGRYLLPRVRIPGEKCSLTVLKSIEVHLASGIETLKVRVRGVVSCCDLRGGSDLAASVSVHPERGHGGGSVAEPHGSDPEARQGIGIYAETDLADQPHEGNRKLCQRARRGVPLPAPYHRDAKAVKRAHKARGTEAHPVGEHVGLLGDGIDPADVRHCIYVVRDILRQKEGGYGRGCDILRGGK